MRLAFEADRGVRGSLLARKRRGQSASAIARRRAGHVCWPKASG